MHWIEYQDCFVARCDRTDHISENNISDVQIGNGITISFARKKRNDISSNLVLCEVVFDKNEWNFNSAVTYWTTYCFQFYSKRVDWNKKIPIAECIVDLDNGDYIGIIVRGTKEKELLYKQVLLKGVQK